MNLDFSMLNFTNFNSNISDYVTNNFDNVLKDYFKLQDDIANNRVNLDGVKLNDTNLDLKYFSVNEATGVVNVGVNVNGVLDVSVIKTGVTGHGPVNYAEALTIGQNNEFTTNETWQSVFDKITSFTGDKTLSEFVHNDNPAGQDFISIYGKTNYSFSFGRFVESQEFSVYANHQELGTIGYEDFAPVAHSFDSFIG